VERSSAASYRTVWTFVSGEVTGVLCGAEVSVRNDDGKTVMDGRGGGKGSCGRLAGLLKVG
jgi:hypothetical protein